jgi:hypothetical protein
LLSRAVVISHFGEDLSHLASLVEPNVIVYTRNPPDPASALPGVSFRIVPNHGAEALPFVQYIVETFDHLPDRVAFVHAHNTSWHQSGSLADLLQGDSTEFT